MLVGKKITLRPIEISDLEKIAEWRNHPDNHKNFFSYSFIIKSRQEFWYNSIIDSKETIIFMIIENKTKTRIGTIGLTNIDFKNQNCEFGNLLIGESKNRGKGFAKEATNEILKYTFNELNMHKIYLKVFADNEISVNFYKKCGFKVEGVLRENHFSLGHFRDVLIMSILSNDFRNII